jgi:hypothetical protein
MPHSRCDHVPNAACLVISMPPIRHAQSKRRLAPAGNCALGEALWHESCYACLVARPQAGVCAPCWRCLVIRDEVPGRSGRWPPDSPDRRKPGLGRGTMFPPIRGEAGLGLPGSELQAVLPMETPLGEDSSERFSALASRRACRRRWRSRWSRWYASCSCRTLAPITCRRMVTSLLLTD